jgi:hypothetical protein
MTTMRQIQTHESVMGLHDGLVDLQVCRRTRQALNIDAPLIGGDAEGLERALLAQQLNLVDLLVTAIVSGTGVALRVLVGHDGSESIVDGTRSDVLGSDERNGLLLTLNLGLLLAGSIPPRRQLSIVTISYHDIIDLGIGLLERLL